MVANDLVYTTNKSYLMPDRAIKEINHTHNYVPLRGYFSLLAVFDLDDKCIGWIDTVHLGYPNARAWMDATKWIDTGY